MLISRVVFKINSINKNNNKISSITVIPVSGHLGKKLLFWSASVIKQLTEMATDVNHNVSLPQSYKCTWHRTSHIDLESAKNCQILAWETCNVYINCDINSNHDSTILTIPIKIDKRVSVIFNIYFNKNF